ncbi:MAG: hypothetical protein LJE92_04610 [Gammaproteobacteria bacterium]|jgi:hypothetical protein|nr:hypothetical protein [Gammaproteobacteria bacterium]HUV20954.1 hypothetical protein [Gammaproteobacteria bacterium]
MNTSPIESWDAAGAIFSFAGGGGATLFCVLTVVFCIVPLFFTLKTENHHENMTK